ncbi:hypothetical protein XarjCFBP7645_08520 [Xanthomonas arboricola]|uniref:Uncharacterized protein n=1 Tax=Xanthomonas arboricola TaxID=56448 RepID=A0A2S7AD36_9XANT|nr:hypothetical protein XarjCFBP7645_08520 [Xanthomonas arboricola]
MLIVLLKTLHTDHLHWSLPAHRRGILSGMDAAPEPTGTYLRRVPRWWAGKGPASKPQIRRSAEWHHTAQRLKPIPDSRFPIPDSPSCTPAPAVADRIAA